jgi:tetratricopeptide (TPR) repeat protein
MHPRLLPTGLVLLAACSSAPAPGPAANLPAGGDVGCPACARDGSFVRDAAVLGRPVALREGIGKVHQPVTTTVAAAQRFCDQGLAYLCSYVWIEAARSFHEALRQDQECVMAWVGLARAEQGLGRHAAARAAIERARWVLGTSLVWCFRDVPTALEWRLVELRGQQIEAQLAAPAERKQKHEAYARALDDALRAFPGEAELWILRGNCAEPSPAGRGQRGTAASIAFYEAALKRAPGHVGAHHFLVHSHENIGDYAAAAAHARIYVAQAPQVPHAHHMLGHVLPRLGQWDEALAAFRAADELEERNARSEGLAPGDDWHHEHNLSLLGWTCVRLGLHADAERAFERLRATPIRDGLLDYNHVALAELLLLRERHEEALRAAEAVALEAGASAKVAGAAVAARALLALGRRDEARARAAAAAEALASGKRALPNDADDLQHLVGYHVDVAQALVAGDETRLRAYAESVARNPRFDSWGSGLFRLATIAAQASRDGRSELAAAVREQMRRIDPGHDPRS